MEEKTILRIALGTSLVGVLFLLLICNFLEIDLIKINEISEELIDENIKIKGKVTNVKETPKVLLFDLEDMTGKIKVIVFSEEAIDLKPYVTVEGTVTEYKGELEVNAKRIYDAP